MIRIKLDSLVALLLLVLVVGCQSGGVAPVTTVGDRGKFHEVQRGETLYSIAFSYGEDYRDVAKRNGISQPYTIYVGQKLKIFGNAVAKKRAPKRTTRATRKDTPKPVPKVAARAPAPVSDWLWPLDGEILDGFSLSGKLNKGIDIAGSEGATVRAAADGVVVYAGGNLRGYGKLVIVKHNDRFLSAYGNNGQIRVKEGDKVKRGQAISEVGKTNADVSMLHFEIRRDGKPENPLNHLPQR